MSGSFPSNINGYELLGPLGEGAFGTVYRARQSQVNREVAVKVILPEYAKRAEFIQRFEAEAQIVAHLEHPHIVPLYDYWRDSNNAYLVMRLMPRTLKDVLRTETLDIQSILLIIEQICSALTFAHRHGVIHRDIKPANILLDEEGNAYLSDFGIAKEAATFRDITMTGAILGSPGYLSPEQVKSEVLTPQADIYALGVTLFELLTNEHPFPNMPVALLILKHLNEPLPTIKGTRADLPDGLDAVIQRATAKNTNDRYPDIDAFLMDFQLEFAPKTEDSIQPSDPDYTISEASHEQGELRFQFLGGLSIELDGVEYSSRLPAKVKALLTYLAVNQAVHSRESLANLLWSDFSENRARSNLRDALTAIRRTPIALFLHVDRRFVSLNSERAFFLDTFIFQQSLSQGRGLSADLAEAQSAINLYKGGFLAGFQINKAPVFEEWAEEQRRSLLMQLKSGLQQMIDYHYDADNYDSALTFTRKLILIDPLREQAHRNQMLLLFLKGQYAAAVESYKECRKILHDELGVEPSVETQTLYQNIQSHIEKSVGTNTVTLDSKVQGARISVFHNLPGEVTPFIGREKEKRAIEIVLKNETVRLITLLGVGGSGKTRLSLAIAENQARIVGRDGSFLYKDGVFFVPLDAVESPTEIVPAISHAIGFRAADEARAERSAEDQFIAHVENQHLLLILDNFEQLLDGVGLLTKILRLTKFVKLLVTSRQKLGLRGERLFTLEGLQYPGSDQVIGNPNDMVSQYSALALFDASARRLKPGFEIQHKEIPALVHLCRLVDGLPLAVELAAGWTDVLSIEMISAEVEKELSILESRLTDFPDRHRNIEAVFDVSWRRLTAAEQNIFKQLCVFRGGFTHEAALVIVGTGYRQLAAFVNKALLQYDEKSGRYHIHPLLRFFGESKLAEDTDTEASIRERHRIFYCDLLHQWDFDLNTEQQLDSLARFDWDRANARAAWANALATADIQRFDQATDGIIRLYLWRRRFLEGEAATRQADESLVALLSSKTISGEVGIVKKALARVRIWRSIFCTSSKASRFIDDAFQLLEDPELTTLDTRREYALGYRRIGDLAFSSNLDEACRVYMKSLALYREIGDEGGVAKVLTQIGWAAVHQGNTEIARKSGEEALSIVRANGDGKHTADILWMLGTLAILQEKVNESNRLLSESLEMRERFGDRITDIMTGPLDLGMTLTWIGRFSEAETVRSETLSFYKSQGRSEQIAMAHIRLATSKMHIGDFDGCEQHAQIGLELCQAAGDHYGSGYASWILSNHALCGKSYEKAKMYMSSALDSLQKSESVAEIGWVKGLQAVVAFQEGEHDLAIRKIHESLTAASGVMGLITVVISLSAYFDLLFDKNRLERAAEINFMLSKHPLYRSAAFEKIYSGPSHKLHLALSPESLKESEARGLSMDFYETATEVIAEIEQMGVIL